MDQSIVMGLAIIAGIVLIVYLFVLAAKRQAKRLREKLQDRMNRVAVENKLTLHRQELFRNRLIGLDEVQKVLVYITMTPDNQASDVVHLSNITGSDVIRVGSKRVETKKNGQKVTEEHVNAIQLQLRVGKDVLTELVFYSEIEDGAEERLEGMVKAETWQDLIASLIKH